MPAAVHTADGKVYIGIHGDAADPANSVFQYGHEIAEGDPGLRNIGMQFLKKVPQKMLRDAVYGYFAQENDDAGGYIDFRGYANEATICMQRTQQKMLRSGITSIPLLRD